MKILYLTPGCFDKGGISRYSRYQITALRDIHGQEKVRVLSMLSKDDHSIEEPFSVFWSGKSNSFSGKVQFTWQLIKSLIVWRPNVVHVAHVNLSGLVYLLSKFIGAKVVLNVYGLEVWSGLSFDAAWGLKNVDYLISDCHFTANYVEINGYRKKNTVEVIWDCVDLEKFQPRAISQDLLKKYGLPDKNHSFYILSLGRLAKVAAHKGYERLLQVFAKFAELKDDAFLVIAGRGDNADYYRKVAEQLGIQDKVIFTGAIDEADMSSVYSSCSVFSLVSDRGVGRGEGIPLTPLEAMACGVPIVVGNHDGSQEAIFQDQNGACIDPFDFEAHQNYFQKLYENKVFLQEQANAARRVAEEHFSYVGFVEKHKAFYKKLKF
jgi:phosphatidylinositol alpha-1,6-mannosyltransferase